MLCPKTSRWLLPSVFAVIILSFLSATAFVHWQLRAIGQCGIDITYAAVGLDITCTLIAIAGALFLRRTIRAHDQLIDSHRQSEEVRALELERFAGRVAHDILSPLGTVAFALELSNGPAA